MKTIAILLTSLFAMTALAQNQGQVAADLSPYTLKVDVDLALFNVTVSDNKDRKVAGLGPENFRIYEEGQPQAINFFRADDVPASIGLVIDNSGSMSPRKDRVVAAAKAFANACNPQDELFILNFNEKMSMGLPERIDFTSDMDEFRNALLSIRASGRTALYDALVAGLKHVQRGRHQRQALVVLSDGADNASTLSLSAALEKIQQSNAVVYTVGIYDPGDRDKNPGVLKRIAKTSGAESYFPESPHELPEIWAEIARGIRSQYTLGFTSSRSSEKEEYRRVTVVATGRDGKSLRVRTRDGYRTAGPVLR